MLLPKLLGIPPGVFKMAFSSVPDVDGWGDWKSERNVGMFFKTSEHFLVRDLSGSDVRHTCGEG